MEAWCFYGIPTNVFLLSISRYESDQILIFTSFKKVYISLFYLEQTTFNNKSLNICKDILKYFENIEIYIKF